MKQLGFIFFATIVMMVGCDVKTEGLSHERFTIVYQDSKREIRVYRDNTICTWGFGAGMCELKKEESK